MVPNENVEQPSGEGAETPDPNVVPAPEPLPSEPPAETTPESPAPSAEEPATPPASDAVENEPPAEAGGTLRDELDLLLAQGKEAATDALKKTAADILVHGRATLDVILQRTGLTEGEQVQVQAVYASAEKHALEGREVQAHNMLRRVTNLLRSREVVKASQRIEAVEGYWKGLLSLLASAGMAFLNTTGTSLSEGASNLATKAAEALLKKI